MRWKLTKLTGPSFNLQSTIRNLQFGGVALRLVLALGTLLLVGLLIAVVLRNFGPRQEEAHRKAARIAEYGLQIALDSLQATPSWTAGLGRTSYDGGTYTVTLNKFTKGDTVLLQIQAEGKMGAASDRRECLFERAAKGADTVWVPRDIH
jgi:hypothetical protein